MAVREVKLQSASPQAAEIQTAQTVQHQIERRQQDKAAMQKQTSFWRDPRVSLNKMSKEKEFGQETKSFKPLSNSKGSKKNHVFVISQIENINLWIKTNILYRIFSPNYMS